MSQMVMIRMQFQIEALSQQDDLGDNFIGDNYYDGINLVSDVDMP